MNYFVIFIKLFLIEILRGIKVVFRHGFLLASQLDEKMRFFSFSSQKKNREYCSKCGVVWGRFLFVVWFNFIELFFLEKSDKTEGGLLSLIEKFSNV